MSEARISHEDLVRYARWLAEERDRAITKAERHGVMRELHETKADAWRLALSFLHIASDGAYGQPYDEQPKGGA